MALIPAVGVDASPHLRHLVDDIDRSARACAAAPDEARRQLARSRRERAALASLRLDGSPIGAAPTQEAIADARGTVEAVEAAEPTRVGTWFDAMRAFDGPDPDDPEAAAHDASLQALEFDGVTRAMAADELGAELARDPLPALVELHRILTHRLVALERSGQLRRIDQAVHDASVGRILYFTVEPDRIATELTALTERAAATAPDEHGVVTSGLVHLELLRIHPFDAANGRLARVAADLLLRATGVDPDGLAAPAAVLDADRLGYHDEVARTLRRRDPTVWLERWAEAVSEGLRDAARELGQLGGEVPGRAEDFLAARPAGAFTVAEHRDETGLDRDALEADRRALLDAGRIVRVPGSRGLRFTTER
ncbi:MAG: Fic family protein [Nitriliruptor sp.]